MKALMGPPVPQAKAPQAKAARPAPIPPKVQAAPAASMQDKLALLSTKWKVS
jgi:hypothetical protein